MLDALVEVPGADVGAAALTQRRHLKDLGLPVRWTSDTWTVLGDDDETIALEPAPTVGVDLGIGIKADPDGNLIRLMAVGGSTS